MEQTSLYVEKEDGHLTAFWGKNSARATISTRWPAVRLVRGLFTRRDVALLIPFERDLSGNVLIASGNAPSSRALVRMGFFLRRGEVQTPDKAISKFAGETPRVRLRRGQWEALASYAETLRLARD